MGFFDAKRVGVTGRDDLPGYGCGPEDAQHFPALVEFLTRDRYEDKAIRERGTLLIFVEGGRLKACFNDKDAGLVGFMSFEGLDTMLDALEQGLQKDKVDWRKQKGQRGDYPRRP
jgi:hypothetical protein